MKAWISKYALTQGVEEVECELCKNGMILVKGERSYEDTYYHGEGKEWHLTKEGAIKKAEEMKLKKVNSLKKQIAKLEKVKFE